MGGLDGKLTNEWCSIVASKLEETNPHCSLAFKKGWVQQRNSRKKTPVCFRAQARCTFTDCALTCLVQVKKSSNKQLCLHVHYKGEIRHRRGERRARYIRGEQRKYLQNELQHSSPSTLYNRRLRDLPPSRLISGSHDGIGRTSSVFQKISSEAKRKDQCHDDVLQSLLILKEDFDSMTSSSRLQGYIQRVHCHPFCVMCFTECGIRIYHHMVKKQPLYCDATGTIVCLKGTKKWSSPLYYALVLRHPNNEFGPVAVGEMITTEHTVTAISHFLECFRRAEATLYGWKNMSTPHHIIIDRSMVLLNSFLKVYNLESISQYLHRCYRVVSGCAEEGDYERVFVLSCVSHVMNSAKHLCRRLL